MSERSESGAQPSSARATGDRTRLHDENTVVPLKRSQTSCASSTLRLRVTVPRCRAIVSAIDRNDASAATQ